MDDAPPHSVFHLTGVTKSFGNGPVLADVDLSVAAGERLAVIGPSGAGKTTLLRLMAALLWPSSGEARTFGHVTSRVRGRALRDLRRRVGFLHQTDNLVPALRVVHNVAMGRLAVWSVPRALLSLFLPRELDRIRAALRDVELEDKLWELPGTLSGGQQQRVAVARLLLQEPEAMLVDEPASSLDLRLGREVVHLLSKTARERGSTLVVSLHDLNLISADFDSVLALQSGRVFWQGRPEELSRDLLRELYGAEFRTLLLDDAPGGE